MSRVVVVGIGTPTFVEADRHFGPGRRTAHFAFALADTGHDVTVLWRRDDPSATSLGPMRCETTAGAGFQARGLPERSFSDGEAARLLREIAPDIGVGATVHGTACLIRAAPPQLPLWADVFGDPMAEAQARAVLDGNDRALHRFWAILAAVLERADRFSAVSDAQAHALVGQLGLAGRLTGTVAGEELVSVIPCAAEKITTAAPAWLRGALVPHDAFVALFTGSFNTWCDVDTMCSGLERAMDLDASLHFVATGGAVPGHCEQGLRALEARTVRSRHRSRFHFLGWIPPARLAALYGESDVGLNVERRLYERRLGAENRVTEWMAHGVPAITTAASEMGLALVERGLAFGVRAGDVDDLSRTLIYLARDRERVRSTGDACRAHAGRYLGFRTTAAPLIEWCSRPHLRAIGNGRSRLALVSDPSAVSGLLDEYLATLGPAELGYRSVRWLWRRLVRRRRGRGAI